MSASSSGPVFHPDPDDHVNLHGDPEDHLPGSRWPTEESAFAGSDGSAGSSLGTRALHGGISRVASGALLSVKAVQDAPKALNFAHVAGGAALAAATVGTAGLALASAGAVLTAVSMTADAVSHVKTVDHIKNLETIQSTGSHACQALARSEDASTDHAYIKDKILQYIIEQKKKKSFKKGLGIVGLGAAVGVHRAVKAIDKKWHGTKGKDRSWYAHVLARHTITCQCGLAEQIVSELFSPQDYLVIRAMNSDQAGDRIAPKMKSI